MTMVTAPKLIIGLVIFFALIVIYVLVVILTSKRIASQKAKKEAKTGKAIEETKSEIKKMKKEKRVRQDEGEIKGRKYLDTLGEELSKGEGEGEFETPDFTEPEFDTA